MTSITQGRRASYRATLTAHQNRTDLQGMRAIAVLTVFFNHLFDWPVGGFVGVDIFFVLSGFFITGILLRERSQSGTLSFKNFYVRRVRRIIPSAVLVITATVIASLILLPAARARETVLDALYALLFAANFRFEHLGQDYFQENLPVSPIQHYWSLSIEEQFYFVWPALLVLIFALTRGVRRRGKASTRQFALFATMLSLVLGSFSYSLVLSISDPSRAYFSTFGRVWELGIGALVAIAGVWLVRIPARLRPALSYLGLLGVLASLFLVTPTVHFPAPWALLPTLSTAVVIAAFHGSQPHRVPLLTNAVAKYFGDTSYTLYLWHWPVIVLLVSLVPPGPTYLAIAISLSLTLTALTYRFYEDPIRKSNWLADSESKRRLSPLHLWTATGAVCASSTLIAILSIHHYDRLADIREEVAMAQRGDSHSSLAAAEERLDPCFGAPAIVTAGCTLWSPNAALRPSIDDFATDKPRETNRCFNQRNEAARSCKFGYDGEDAVRIALVGDSKALFLLPAILPILEPNRWQLTTFLGKDCALMNPPKDGCSELMSRAESALLTDPFDLAVMVNMTYGVENQSERHRNAWGPIMETGTRIAVVADNPTSSEEAIACLTRLGFGADRLDKCGTPVSEAFPKQDELLAAAQQTPGVSVVDLTPYYCVNAVCPAIIGNVIVHMDTTHITATFSRTLQEPLGENLRQALTQ